MQLVNGMSPERFTAFIETTRLVFSETVGMKIEPDFGINDILVMFTKPDINRAE